MAAMLDWLALDGRGREAAEARVKVEPLAFLSDNLHVLPPHLLESFAKVLSPQERGTTTRIRSRRRNWAHTVRPDELSVQESRKREPLLYKSIMATVQRRGAQMAGPSRPVGSATADAVPSMSKPVLVEPDNVEKQPRFAAVVDRFEEEDVLLTLRRQQGRSTADVDGPPEDEEEEDVDDDETDDAREDQFRDAVIERFVRGDVSSARQRGLAAPSHTTTPSPPALASRGTVSV